MHFMMLDVRSDDEERLLLPPSIPRTTHSRQVVAFITNLMSLLILQHGPVTHVSEKESKRTHASKDAC
jgi:hypothetical protein